MGCEHTRYDVRMPLDDDIIRRKTERQAGLPAATTDAGTVKLVEYHGSARPTDATIATRTKPPNGRTKKL